MDDSKNNKTLTPEELAKLYGYDKNVKLSYNEIKGLIAFHNATETGNTADIKRLSDSLADDSKIFKLIAEKRRNFASNIFGVNGDMSEEQMNALLRREPKTLQEIEKIHGADKELSLEEIKELYKKYNGRPIKAIEVVKKLPKYNASRKKEPEIER